MRIDIIWLISIGVTCTDIILDVSDQRVNVGECRFVHFGVIISILFVSACQEGSPVLDRSQQEADSQLLISARLRNVDYRINYLGSEHPCSAVLAVVIGRTISP